MVPEQWWLHNSEKIVENINFKLLWDFTIFTDKSLPHNRPDIITLVDKQQEHVYFIEVSVPGDSRISQKSVEKKVSKYMLT